MQNRSKNAPKIFDVLAIGNPIVDIIARESEAFLVKNGIAKAAMTLIDEKRAEDLYDQMGQRTESSGGSAANAIEAVVGFGGKAAYFGKVADDELGDAFRQDLQGQGVTFTCPPLPKSEGIPTARSMIFITPDGERSMNTYLGACSRFSKSDIDDNQIAASRIVYFEGYLWDAEKAKEAILYAADLAHDSGGKVAMGLSDFHCVARHRDDFKEILQDGIVDFVFGNQAEYLSLEDTADLGVAVRRLREMKLPLAVITRSADGAVIVTEDEIFPVPAVKVENVVDTTGAGDLYTGGFLYGLTQTMPVEACSHLGAFAAGLVIQQIGSRLTLNLRSMAVKAGLLPPEKTAAV